MQIKETIGVSFPGFAESSPLEDVVVIVDRASVALGMRPTVSARARDARDGGSGLVASRGVEISLVGRDGGVSGVLCCELYFALLNLCRPQSGTTAPKGFAMIELFTWPTPNGTKPSIMREEVGVIGKGRLTS